MTRLPKKIPLLILVIAFVLALVAVRAHQNVFGPDSSLDTLQRALAVQETGFNKWYQTTWARFPLFRKIGLLRPVPANEIRAAAAEFIGRRGPSARPAVPALVTALDDLWPSVRLSAAEALLRIGNLSEDQLLRLSQVFESPLIHRSPQWMSETFAAPLNRDKLFLLVNLANGSQPQTSGDAAERMRKLGPDAGEYLPILLPRLENANAAARAATAAAFGIWRLSTAIGPLEKSLADPSERVRCEAAYSLTRIDGRGIEGFLPIFADGMRSDTLFIRRRTAHRAGSFGRGAELLVPLLLRALDDPDYYIRRNSADALWKINGDPTGRGLETLIKILEHPEGESLWPVAMMIMKRGPEGTNALPALKKARTKNMVGPDFRTLDEAIAQFQKYEK